MPDKLSNSQRKKNVGNAIKAQEARRQASIDACNARRAENKLIREERIREAEQARIHRSRNLNNRMVIIYAKIAGVIIILAIVDPSLMMSSYSFGMNHHIMYGDPKYRTLEMIASYNNKGMRSERKIDESYTVSTDDGVNFNVIGTDGNHVFSFTSSIDHPTLVGKSVSSVQFNQFWYDPSKCSSDHKTSQFYAELDRLIKADTDYHRS